MTADNSTRNTEDEQRLADEAHLLDLGNLPEIALWIASAVGSGVLGNTAFDLLKSVRKRSGDRGLDELKKKVLGELKDAQRRQQHLSLRDLRLRVDQLFRDFDS